MTSLSFETTRRVYCEPGASAKLGELMAGLGASRVVLVTDPGVMKLGLPKAALDSLAAAGIEVAIFDKTEADPPEHLVHEAVALAKQHKADGVVGFGGGSSDAATVLCVLDRLWGLGLGEDRLAALGLRLGADVPVFVRGRSAWAEGVGERLRPLSLPPAWYLLVDPGVHVPTAELFRAPDLTRNSPPATISDFIAGAVLDNAFEPVLRRREPAVEAAFAALAQVGTPRLTGSGGGCFVEFADRAGAEDALARLPRGLRAWIAAGVDESPLRAALAAPRA